MAPLIRSEVVLGLPLALVLLLLLPGPLGLLALPEEVLGVHAHLLDLVLALPEDGHVVVDDGVLGARRLELEEDPLLLAAGVLGLVDIAPAVGLVGAGQALALVLAQFVQGLGLKEKVRLLIVRLHKK